MFKNLIIYTLHPDFQFPGLMEMDVALRHNPFTPCSPSQDKTFGWVPPRGDKHGALVESVAGQRIARLQIETKSVPSSAINRRLDEITAKIEETEGRKPGRKECRDLKEDILQELLPHAFPKTTSVWVWFDLANRRVVLDTASQSRADDVVTALVLAFDGLALSPLQTNTAPLAAMTGWLTDAESLPPNFVPGRHVELHSEDEMKSVVKFDRHHLADDQMRLHIGQGKLPTKLALEWSGRVSFVLTHGLQLRKIELMDVVVSGEREADEFDADVAICTAELSNLIDELIDGLGGEMDHVFEPEVKPAPKLDADDEEMYEKAVSLVKKDNIPSISYVQRKLQIGYNRAARLLEAMERNGLVSPMSATGQRTVIA